MTDIPTSIEDVDVDALAGQIIDEIQRPRQGDITAQGADGYLDAGGLPGFADEPLQDDCGEVIPHFCTDCGSVVKIGRTCKQSRCPRCAPSWCVDRAEPKIARLQSVAKYMSSRLGVPVFKHHVVISPPDDWYLYADDPVDRTFEVVKNILKLLNAEGVICYHGWTGRAGDDRGEWKRRMFNDRSWEDDVRHELKENPHFHCIVASPFIAGGEVTKRVEAETGWVIDRIADESTGKSLEDMTAVARALTYSLSHTSILTSDAGNNIAQVRTFGEHWHGSPDTRQVNVYDNVRRQAEIAVRKVAPTTLGVSPKALRCESPVPESEQRDETIDHTDSYDDPDGSSSDNTESGSEDGSEDEPVVECKAPIKPISKADEFLEDDDWTGDARFVDQLRREYDDWIALTKTDRPPPLVAAFSD